MDLLDLLRSFGFRGQEKEAGLFLRGFDCIPPEFAPFKDQIRAALGDTSYRSAPSTQRNPVFDEASRSVSAILTTETPVLMPDFERWEMNDESLLMSGFKGIRGGGSDMPFLNSHNRASADDVIGTTDSLVIEGDALAGRNIFSSTEEKLYTKAKEGHIRANSIGYRVLQTTYIPAGETAIVGGKSFTASEARALRIATSWEVHENSLTPIGADTRAGHRSKSPIVPFVPPTPTPSQKDAPMDPKTQAKALGAPESALVSDETARTWIADYQAQQQRAQNALLGDEIRSIFSGALEVPGVRAVLDAQLALAKDGKTNSGTARQALSDACVAHSLSLKGLTSPGSGGQGTDGAESFRADMSAALLLRNSPEIKHDEATQKRAKAFRGISSIEFARQLAQRHNIDVSGLDPGAMVKHVLFSPDGSAAQRASVSDLKDITNAVARLTIQNAFDAVPATWQDLCRTVSLPDFESHTLRNFGAMMGEVPEVAELGEFRNRSDLFLKEDNSTKLKKFGEEFSISWEGVLADQLGAFAKVGAIHAANWARTLNRMPLRLLAKNPKMGDGVALFHASHGNLITGSGTNVAADQASALAAIKAHRLALRKQAAFGAKDDKLDILDVPLRIILAGADAEEFLFNALFEGGRADLNTAAFTRSLAVKLQTDAILGPLHDPTTPANGEKVSYGFAGLGAESPLVMAFLNGNPAPMLSQRFDEEKEAFIWRVKGAAVPAASTWRGITKATGA